MRDSQKHLQENVLDVFERACQENDLEVAEHLLQALEVMTKREGTSENRTAPASDAGDCRVER